MKTDAINAATHAEQRNHSIDYLRSLVIIAVVFFHSALAYVSFAALNKADFSRNFHPVADPFRWPPAGLSIVFDTFLMPLMFFLSGYFTLSGLQRKGSLDYIASRIKRLGVPFLIGIFIVAPIAWWPAWKLSDQASQSYFTSFFALKTWPIGPPWFLWVLIVYNVIVVLLYRFIPLTRRVFQAQPGVLTITVITVVSSLSLALFISDDWFSTFGPFDVQTSRTPVYLAYFMMGIAAGSNKTWIQAGLPKHWLLLLILGLVSFIVYLGCITGQTRASNIPAIWNTVLTKIAYSGCCIGFTFGSIGISNVLLRKYSRALNFLKDNTFGVYLIHYPVLSLTQYALLDISISPVTKLGISFFIGVFLTLIIVWLLRKNVLVRQYI